MNFLAIALAISATALETGDITSELCPNGAGDCGTDGFKECIKIDVTTGTLDASGVDYCASSSTELGENDQCLNQSGQLLGPCPDATACTIIDTTGTDLSATCVSTQAAATSTDAPAADVSIDASTADVSTDAPTDDISTDATIGTDTGSTDVATEAFTTDLITTEVPGPTVCPNGDSVCADNETCVVIDDNGLASETTSGGINAICLVPSSVDGNCYDGTYFTGYCVDQLCVPDLDANTSTCRTPPTSCPNGDECDPDQTCQDTSAGSFTTPGEDKVCLASAAHGGECFDGYFYDGACPAGDLCVADPGSHTGSCQTPPTPCDSNNPCVVDTTFTPQFRAESTAVGSTADGSTADGSTDASIATTEAATFPSGPMCVSIANGFANVVVDEGEGICLSPVGIGEECNDGYFDVAYCASGICARNSGAYTSSCKNAPRSCPTATECDDNETCVVINSDGYAEIQTENEPSGSGQCLIELAPGDQCFNGVFNDGFCGTGYFCGSSGDGSIGTCQLVGGSTEVPTEVLPEGPTDQTCTGRLDPYCANDCVTINGDGSANYITEDENVAGFCMPVAIGGETCTETSSDGTLVYTHYCEEGLKCESVASDQNYQCTGDTDGSVNRIAPGIIAFIIAILLF